MNVLGRLTKMAAVAAVGLVATACLPPNPGPGGLYLGQQADITPSVTAKAAPITWGSAPNIDENYGGTLYAGTGLETQDPRPALVEGNQPLRMWVADPQDGRTDRPVILWFHGGGFAVGIDSMYGLANGVGKDYAKRGYVSISVEYRIDTTLVGTGTRPPSLCQWVQDYTGSPTDPTYIERRNQCARNIYAAQYDALAAIRWVRANADELGIDPNRVAVGGFSAGAVISYAAAYQWDQVGTVSYFAGDSLDPLGSRPQAAIGASGFLPTMDGTAPATVQAGDAPTSMIASRFDQAAAYPSTSLTTVTARGVGLVAELTSYCNESLHAANLYAAHRAATDEQWTTFLARELLLYSDMRPASSDPVCAN